MRRKPLFPPPKNATTGRNQRNKGRQKFSVLTVNGRITLRRRRWHSPGEGSSTPIDAALDVAEATVTLGVLELACRLNGNSSNFDKTAENLGAAAQIRVSGETVRQWVEAEGKAVLAAAACGALPVGWNAAECKLPTSEKSRVYLGSDGVTVPVITDAEKKLRRQKVREKRRRRGRKSRPLPPARRGHEEKYKELKLVTYYDESQQHRHVTVTRGDHRVAGRLMRRDAKRIDLWKADEKIGIVDGADWIRNRIAGQNLPLDALGLDFYHLAENVHKARRAVYGEDASGLEWAGTVLHTAKHSGYDGLWDELCAWRGRWRGPRRKAADRLLHYVSERQEMIRYPEFLERGWQIGSGPTEAQCKTTTSRLKHCGMRWDCDNAESIAALSALDQSGQWDLYWSTRLRTAG